MRALTHAHAERVLPPLAVPRSTAPKARVPLRPVEKLDLGVFHVEVYPDGDVLLETHDEAYYQVSAADLETLFVAARKAAPQKFSSSSSVSEASAPSSVPSSSPSAAPLFCGCIPVPLHPKGVKHEPDGTWSVTVWDGDRPQRFVYRSRAQARAGRATDQIGENGRVA
jgi:hypothetical protein